MPREYIANYLDNVEGKIPVITLTNNFMDCLDENTKRLIEAKEAGEKISKSIMLLTLCLVLIGYSQLIIQWQSLSNYYLWGNLIVIGIFLLSYFFIFKEGKK